MSILESASSESVGHGRAKFDFPMPDTSQVGLKMLENSIDTKTARTLAGLDADSLNAAILTYIEKFGDEGDIEAHNQWVVGHKSRRFIRMVERLAGGALVDKEQRPINSFTLSIPLIDDKHVLWSKVDPLFRSDLPLSLARLMNVAYQPIDVPENDHPTEVNIGCLAIKNTLLTNADGLIHTSKYDFVKIS